jgi:hypothetical protein
LDWWGGWGVGGKKGLLALTACWQAQAHLLYTQG